MEDDHRKKGRIGRIIVYLLLLVAAVGLGIHFFKPKEVDISSNKNMTLFIDNKIIDIDQELAVTHNEADIATRLSWHKSNHALYDEVKSSKDKEIATKREELKKKMVKVQGREFPELRNAYVESKKEVLATQHIDIALSGDHKDVLMISGEMFEAKKSQKAFTNNIQEIVNDLRFKKIVYKWSDEKNAFADYKIDSKNDTAI
ncbi:hypothetical protein [Dyadobacter sp. CY323]|uniref:hypothetical protein n=1 Tax=Dyadobacter sp. CY323 TaxID=2907302 RepID=UPI001F3ADD6E|nr:hypothetical protein [Dyadobacter sp. CY323]MCE6990138.1 hypothetical protein [Dyadobacter sp. CY323]